MGVRRGHPTAFLVYVRSQAWLVALPPKHVVRYRYMNYPPHGIAPTAVCPFMRNNDTAYV